jgi:hypothetical protein
MDKDYLTASAIIIVGLLSGLNHKATNEDDPSAIPTSEWNPNALSIYQISGVTAISNWPRSGEHVYISANIVSLQRG